MSERVGRKLVCRPCDKFVHSSVPQDKVVGFFDSFLRHLRRFLHHLPSSLPGAQDQRPHRRLHQLAPRAPRHHRSFRHPLDLRRGVHRLPHGTRGRARVLQRVRGLCGVRQDFGGGAPRRGRVRQKTPHAPLRQGARIAQRRQKESERRVKTSVL